MRTNELSRNAPVSATKYPRPSYNKLQFEVRLMASVYINEGLHVQKPGGAARSPSQH